MIPKIIHYTWFSSEVFPKKIKECIESWQRYLPEYEFVLWDLEKIEKIDNFFLKESLSEKKWAFASDYVRLYAVYNYGGIYLDTDVEIYKSFNNLISQKCFIGRENSYHLVNREVCSFLSSHCFGAEKNNFFIKKCLDYYEGRHFVLSTNVNLPNELRLDMTLLPFIQAKIAKSIGWDWAYNKNNHSIYHEVSFYPSTFFDPQHLSSESYCKHLALGSWRESEISQEKVTLRYKIKWRIKKIVTKTLWKFSYIMIKV
ncbi:glycosyltransferase family 32 protein [Lutibacter flavus]|uniref:Glycosyltransferase sugar-binding region containing DXD motif-containing protein n=1 Tax=Lutibacter flavus TaxID=691689 RepID=A0A238YZN2_9FLAO|nr:glycosyltransferase [Lutibacter flavus]SNR76019.1 Glycosyltransferase sugar-binding region containing DXD motif-containing protein [Lutibacter flavus]